MALKKSTIKQLKALGLHTDFPNDDFALRVINMELDKIKAEQWKAEEERRAKEAAKTWPQELSIGAEIVEVASERHTQRLQRNGVTHTNTSATKGHTTSCKTNLKNCSEV